jgi:hypothetical protein
MRWIILVCLLLAAPVASPQDILSVDQTQVEIEALSAQISSLGDAGIEPDSASLARLAALERQIYDREGPPAILDQGGENCGSATVIPASANVAYCVSGIMGQTDDCTISSSCGGVSSNIYRDVFYSFTPQVAGIYIASMCGSVSDTWLRVWSGTCGSGTAFACDNDSCSANDPRRTMTLVAGTTYYFECGYRYSNQPADAYNFNLFGPLAASPPAPANDNCSGAIALAIPSTIAGTTRGANTESQPQLCDGTSSSVGGVWYTVIGNGHLLTARTHNSCSTFDSRVRVFKGICGSITCVGGNDNAGPASSLSSYSWCSDLGVTYFVIVSNSATSLNYRGPFTLEILNGILCSCTAMYACGTPHDIEMNNDCQYFDDHLVYCNDVFYGLHCPEADSDFYRTFVPARSVMTLSLFDGPACADNPANTVRMRLYDGNCAVLGAASTSTLTINRCAASTDTVVYVTVFDATLPGTSKGPYKVTTTCTIPATHDACSGAITVAVPSQTLGTTLGCATLDNAPSCSGCDDVSPGVWYRVIGNDHRITASTCNSAADFDTRISVYSGGCGALACVTADDNDDTCGAGFSTSSVIWAAENGVEYFVLVHGSGSGNFRLDLRDGPGFHSDCGALFPCGTPLETEPNGPCPDFLDPLTIACNSTVYGAICPASDVDAYTLTIPPLSRITITLQDGDDCDTSPPGCVMLDVLDNSCESLVTSNRTSAALSNATTLPVSYLLEVKGNETCTARYRISTACCDLMDYCAQPLSMGIANHFEQTVSTCCAAAAIPAVFMSTCHGPSKPSSGNAIFKFTLGSAGLVTLQASGAGDVQLMVMSLCGDTASCVASSDAAGAGEPEFLSNLHLSAGIYFVSVSFADTCGSITLTADSDVPLPVVLLGEPAISPGDGTVTLGWSTASETDLRSFEIFRNDALAGRVSSPGFSEARRDYQWTDRGLINGNLYRYALRTVNRNGSVFELATLTATPNSNASVITAYALHQNYPNPFNAATSVVFDLPEPGATNVAVYNLVGQRVATLASRDMSRGRHTILFDASSLSSGIYLYRLEVNGQSFEKKMLLIK